MATECTKPKVKRPLKRKAAESREEQNCPKLEISDDFKFLNGLIYLNSLLLNTADYRIPRYTLERFGNACDIIKVFPSLAVTKTADEFLKTCLDQSMWIKLISKPSIDPNFFKLMEFTKNRIHKLFFEPSQSNLKFCTPWLSKEKPRSVNESQKRPLKGKIYITISTRNSAKDDLLVVQETENCIGYMPPVFSAKATVAFPPICKGEVWTVGWIQALKKATQRTYCNLNEL